MEDPGTWKAAAALGHERVVSGMKALSKLIDGDDDDVEEELAREMMNLERYWVEFWLSEPLGLELEEVSSNGRLRVRRLLEGGAAARSGRIMVGDVLEMVGNRNVGSMSALEDALSGERTCGKFKANIGFGRRAEFEDSVTREVSRLEQLLAEERATSDALRDRIEASEAKAASNVVSANVCNCLQSKPQATPSVEDWSRMRAERASLRAELADAKKAAQRAAHEAEVMAAEMAKSHATAMARQASREHELEAALAATETKLAAAEATAESAAAAPRPSDGTEARLLSLEDELKGAREALDSQRRASNATLNATKRATAAEHDRLRSRVRELETELSKAKESLAVASENLSRVSSLPTVDTGALERRVAQAEHAAGLAAKSAVEARSRLDDVNAERSALEAKLRAAQDKASKLQVRLKAAERQHDAKTNNRRHDELKELCRSRVIISSLRLLDNIGQTAATLLKGSLFARLFFVAYILLLHAWTFLIFAAKTIALSVDPADGYVDGDILPPRQSLRLRGASSNIS